MPEEEGMAEAGSRGAGGARTGVLVPQPRQRPGQAAKPGRPAVGLMPKPLERP